MKKTQLFTFIFVLLLSILVVSPVYADQISLVQTVQASQTAVYQIELFNDTPASHEYTLAVNGLPDSLAARFSQTGPQIEKINLGPDAYETIQLEIQVPAETPVGHYTAQFVSTREDGTVLAYPLSLNVENTYALKISSQNLNLSTFSGKEFSFDVTASNNGAASVSNLSLVIDAPAKWIISTTPASLPNLDAGTQTVMHVQVQVPSSQAASDQTLTMALSSDQTTSPESTLTVRVQKSPALFYIALGLMALAIGSGWVYFRSKGRR